MITDDNIESLEKEVREILAEAGWADPPEPDYGRIEVVAYRACLEAARTSSPATTCCSAPIHRPSAYSASQSSCCCLCGSSILSLSRFQADRFDQDPWTGPTRA
ncbi:MAG: hypothetical protein VCA38_13770 [Roseibacillus sp.]|jgi:hypothetical protein